MRFASFRSDGAESYGVVRGDNELIDLQAAGGADAPGDLLALIAAGDAGLEFAAAASAEPPPVSIVPAQDVEWLPPVPRPGKICGIAMNNSASNERKISAPPHPAFDSPPPRVSVR